jgi:hypothetical protein
MTGPRETDVRVNATVPRNTGLVVNGTGPGDTGAERSRALAGPGTVR